MCHKVENFYRNKWRVSSPYYASSINTFPTSVYNAFTFMKPIEKLSVIIRKDDWTKFDNVFKKDKQQINILLRKIRFFFLLIEGRLEHDPRKLKAISDKNYFLSSNLENITIPKIMLQSPSMNLKKHFYPYNIRPDLVSRTLSCPLQENTFILHQEDSDSDNDDCHPGKYLFSNGKIQQRFCFTTSCTRCQKDFFLCKF